MDANNSNKIPDKKIDFIDILSKYQLYLIS